jgi:hypothetical protein
LGVAAIEKFLAAGWEVVGVSRRKPSCPVAAILNFCPPICGTTKKARTAFEPLIDITHTHTTSRGMLLLKSSSNSSASQPASKDCPRLPCCHHSRHYHLMAAANIRTTLRFIPAGNDRRAAYSTFRD